MVDYRTRIALPAVLLGYLLGHTSAPAQRLDPAQKAYVLGPHDQLNIHALEVDGLTDKPIRIDEVGEIRLPLIGSLRASGLTVEQLGEEIRSRLGQYIKHPEVSIAIAEYGSQPVSVMGAVRNPGVYQLQGQKRLVDILSLAGGLRDDAGSSIIITRRVEYGSIPLPGTRMDPTGQFSITEVSLQSILEGENPAENILVRRDDIISIPRAKMIYVLGEVHKTGGFVLRDRETMSVLVALSLAEGLDRTAAAQHACILRLPPGADHRVELAVDLKRIMAGKAADVPLQPEDVLFVPNSLSKNWTLRSIESAIQIGTGLVIWRR